MNIKKVIFKVQEKIGLLSNKFFYAALLWKVANKSSPSILDVGCGKGSRILKQMRQNIKGQYIVGCDVFPQYIKESKKTKIYDELVLADANHLPFKPNTFSSVFCFEVIEHLPKNDGEKLLINLENISIKEILLSLPVGYMYQGPCEGNTYHTHKSEWFPKDFKKKKYAVLGVVGPFFIRRKCNYSSLDKYLMSLAEPVIFAMQPLYHIAPNIALKMICFKRIKNKC